MKRIWLITLSFVLILSCTDLLEKDLKNEVMQLNVPLDGDSLSNFTVNFWWEEVEGAENYRLQIVEGSFNIPIALQLDSLLSTNVFDFTLSPGEYEWRVKAMNNSTETEYVTRRFVVVANQDLSNDAIILASPSDGFYTNQTAVNFSWFLNQKADDYLVDIQENGSLILPTIVSSADNVDVIDFVEGAYTWSVQGRNSTSVSIATERSFTVDLTAPTQPSLVAPFNNAVIDTNVVNLSWQHGNSLSPISDSVLVYSDSLVTLSAVYIASSENQEVSLPSAGTYFWRVRSLDAAGNVSLYSNARKLIIN